MQEITDFLWEDDFLHIHNIRKTENVYAKFEKIHRRTSFSFCFQVQRKMIRYEYVLSFVERGTVMNHHNPFSGYDNPHIPAEACALCRHNVTPKTRPPSYNW